MGHQPDPYQRRVWIGARLPGHDRLGGGKSRGPHAWSHLPGNRPESLAADHRPRRLRYDRHGVALFRQNARGRAPLEIWDSAYRRERTRYRSRVFVSPNLAGPFTIISPPDAA